MKKARQKLEEEHAVLRKSPTGIRGLDEVTGGGIPTGRPTLIAGAAGAGKTLLGMEFLVRGAQEHGEPGVFVTFEETAQDLVKNTQSLGFNIPQLIKEKKLALDHVYIERGEIEEFYDRVAPSGKHYHHDDTWGDANGFSHVRASFTGPSLVIPFEKRTLLLGTWQQVVLAEFDNRPRDREIVVQITGE